MPSKSTNTENDQQSTPLTDPGSQLEPQKRPKNHEKSEKVALDVEEDDPLLTSCGMGSWRPPWMQVFNSPFIFMLNLGLIGIIQGMTGPLFFSSISTLEKRFGFDSKISGVILIVDNFADMILNPLIGYLGVRYNRARLVGIGELILAFGSFLTASPYLIYGPATHLLSSPNSTSSSSLLSIVNPNTSLSSFCTADGIGEDCAIAANQGVTVWPAVAILMFGSWLRGMGYTAFFVVGVPYLDDNIKKESSPLMISIMQSMRLVGPAFGFMLSSFCLGFYENPFVDPGFGPTDPRFVGAWWMAFVVVGFLLLIAGVPMLFFPFQFKGASVKGSEIQAKMTERGGSRGALKRYLANPIILLFVLANIFRYIGLGGYIMLKSKYIEAQFRRSSSSASFITGFTSYFPMAVGIMAGGSLLSFLKPKARTIFILVFLVEGVSFFTVGSGLFLGCEPIKIAGSPANGAFSLDATCNAACDCTTRVYKPLCGPDQATTYFSPCHAGCTSYNASSGAYEDCSCFPGAQATPGYCPADVDSCGNLVAYISVVAVGNLIASFARTPNSLIFLRSVDPIDKSFAVGLSSTLFDIFAFIPYPLIFGYIADSACLIWEEKCGKTGNCWAYDNDLFRKLLHGAAITFYALGSFFEFLLIFFAHRVKNFYDDDEEIEAKMAKEMTVGYSVKEERLKDGALRVKPSKDGEDGLKS